MTIKEVETLTGLTAKSIRYYETQGLITVNRKDGNNYRDYTEENIEQLKKIKLFRYLDFSVEEIKEIFAGPPERKIELFDQKKKEQSSIADKSETKQMHLQTLISDTKNGKDDVESIIENIEFWESIETEEFRATIKDISIPTLNSCIYQTIIFGSPIINLLFRAATDAVESLVFHSIWAIISTVILTMVWSNYFRTRKYAKEEMKKKNKKQTIIIWKVLFLVILVGVVCIILSSVLDAKLLSPKNWLFLEHNETTLKIMSFYSFVLLAVIVSELLSLKEKIGKEQINVKNLIISFVCAILIWLIIFYCFSSNKTYVTENSVVVCTPLNPTGTVYALDEIEKIETGFGSERFTIFEHKRKGAFYYKIYLDGKEIIFHQPSTNDIERYNDTYLELEEFDQALMKLGIEKTSSSDFSEYCEFDQRYVDRFLRIINNK